MPIAEKRFLAFQTCPYDYKVSKKIKKDVPLEQKKVFGFLFRQFFPVLICLQSARSTMFSVSITLPISRANQDMLQAKIYQSFFY
jgi:hypothetical protein